jgi:hypothetical protein
MDFPSEYQGQFGLTRQCFLPLWSGLSLTVVARQSAKLRQLKD